MEKIKVVVLQYLLVVVALVCFANYAYALEENKLGLRKVDSSLVCMINDKVFTDKQIPVEVEGKTYYGCCEMCETKLRTNAASRYAKDPISGKQVDKSQAIIAANAKGKVFYFESEETLRRLSQ